MPDLSAGAGKLQQGLVRDLLLPDGEGRDAAASAETWDGEGEAAEIGGE